MADANAGLSGRLDAALHRAVPSTIPGEVQEWLHSIGYDATQLARDLFSTRLHVHHLRPDKKGKYIAGEHFGDESHPLAGQPHRLVEARDLGPGLITNAGANFIANIANFMTAATPFALVDTFRYHGIGTGATAAAATDYSLQTAIAAGSLAGSTNGYMTDTQTGPTTAAPSTFKSVATFTLNATLAVTEWGLFMNNAAAFTGRSATSTTATSLTDTGASFTNTGNKLAGWVIEANASAINTPTTTAMGLIAVNGSNSGTVLNLAGSAWQTLANASASTPSGTTNYVIYPCMLDRKSFAAINGVVADTVQFSYSNAVSSGT